MSEAAAIILAGGKSTRMGQNKALVRVKKHRMLEAIIRTLSGRFAEILVSANDNSYDDLNLRTVTDIFPGSGPLGGIHAGLKASGYNVNFVVACDMPFTDPGMAAYMVRQAEGYDAVVPRIGEYYQPLFAVYTKNCLGAIETQLTNKMYKIISFYPLVKIRYMGLDEISKFGDPDRMFFNVNTPHDLETAKAMAWREEDGSGI